MQIGPGLMLPMLRPSGATALPPSAWAALLDSLQTETDGLILYFEDPDYPRALIRDTTTPANAVDTDANSVLTMTSPALKNVMGADGTIKYANHNLLTYSNTFSNAAWTKENVSVAQNVDSPLGTGTGWTLTASAGASNHWMYWQFSISATRRFLIRAKAGTTGWMAVGDGSSPSSHGAYFNLSTGAVGTVNGRFLNATVTATTDGYYICAVTTTGADFLSITLHTSDNQALSWNAAGTETVLIAGAHALAWPAHNAGTEADYVPTTTAARYRLPIEYDTAGDPIGLLVEEARTNLCLRSEELGNASWTPSNATVSANATTAPDGTSTADKLIPTTANNALHRVRQDVTVSSGTNYVFSCYVKAGEYTKAALRESAVFGAYATFNLSTVAVISTGNGTTSATITSVGNSFYRITLYYAAYGSTTFGCSLYAMDNSYVSGDPASYSFAGNDSDGLFYWGAQLEAGSY